MSKKQMNKKKISLKLVAGQSAVVMDYETLMHIAETYDYLGREKNDEWSQSFFDIADAIRLQASENLFESIDEYEEW